MRDLNFRDLFSVEELNGSLPVSFSKIESCIEKIDINLIVVDFDGTLCRNNSMIVQLTQVKSLARYFKLVKQLFFGKADFKAELSSFVPVISTNLNLRVELLDWLVKMQKNGLEVVVATASVLSFVSNHLTGLGRCFSVLGTTKFENLKGEVKSQSIRRNYPSAKYVYFGDSKQDIPVWASSSLPILVCVSSKKSKRINKLFTNLPRLDIT